jgi:transposase InsO family protein
MGRRFRALTVLDVFTRESLAIEVGQRLKGEHVVGALNQIREKRGGPKLLFCDNGSEFASQIMDLWAYHNHVQIDFPGQGSRPTTRTWNRSSFNKDDEILKDLAHSYPDVDVQLANGTESRVRGFADLTVGLDCSGRPKRLGTTFLSTVQ